VVVRARLDGRTGRFTESEVAMSDLGDADEATCIATALRAVSLPPGTADWARVVDVTVPVRLAN
jgi:hypothetical protein